MPMAIETMRHISYAYIFHSVRINMQIGLRSPSHSLRLSISYSPARCRLFASDYQKLLAKWLARNCKYRNIYIFFFGEKLRDHFKCVNTNEYMSQ